MSALAGLAVIPALGGALFLAFLAAAQHTDLKVQRAEALGRRVLPRPWSIVSDDPRTLGHWLTLAAASVLATTVPATSIWQNNTADENDVVLVVFASLAAVAFFLMALVPHRDSRSAPSVTFSAVWHLVTSGAFLGFGTVHAIRAAIFAIDAFQSDTMLVVRAILAGLMCVCVLAQLFGGLYLYYISAKAFNKHYYPVSGAKPDLSQLSEEEDIQLRKKMCLLFVLQAVWGLAYGALIATCAGEVSRLKGDADVGGIVAGVTFAVTVIVSLVAYFMCCGRTSLRASS